MLGLKSFHGLKVHWNIFFVFKRSAIFYDYISKEKLSCIHTHTHLQILGIKSPSLIVRERLGYQIFQLQKEE